MTLLLAWLGLALAGAAVWALAVSRLRRNPPLGSSCTEDEATEERRAS